MIQRFLSFTLVATSVCWGQAAASPTPADPAHTGADAGQQKPAQTTNPAPQPPSTTNPSPAPKPASPPETAPDTAAAVPATQPVITIQGVCATSPAKRTGTAATGKKSPATTPADPSACKTLITKSQFDKLLDAVNTSHQNVSPAMRRNLAQVYVELLTFNQAAQKAGIDKNPSFAEVLRLQRMQLLKEFYRRYLEEKYRNPPASEIQAYYEKNLTKYEEIKLSRIFIPAKNPSAQNKDDWEKKAAQVANDIHDRAAKGEDFEKLQKEAYTTLGLTITPPSTAMGSRRKGMMSPQEEQELFTLRAGELSKVEQQPAGYVIYKIDSRQTLSADQVKDEISRELFRQKLDTQLKAITAAVHADFNDQYFGPAPPPRPPVGAGPGVGPGGPPAPRQPAPKPAEPSPTPTAPAQAPPK